MTGKAERDALRARVDELTPQQVVVVHQYVDALLAPVNAEVDPTSWFATPVWADAFLTRIRAHHALSVAPLSREQFETAFEAACKADGWSVTTAGSAVQRFYDTKIMRPGKPAVPISLKTTAARSLSEKTVHISKLTEAAWIQDARTRAARREQIVTLFKEFRGACDCIIILRCFRRADGLLYELVEIPSSLFSSVDQLDQNQAWRDTIGIPPGSAQPHLKIRIDRSDSKVTLSGIELSACTVHGRWHIAPSAAVAD